MRSRRPTLTDWIEAGIAAGVLLVAAACVVIALSATAEMQL